MDAIVVTPRTPHSARLAQMAEPALSGAPDGRGVLVRVLRVGLDGTDREIDDGEYGDPPPGDDFLVLGHESFGVVEEVGHTVTELRAGDFVVALVRGHGDTIYDEVERPDFSTADSFREHGINRLHGFLTERYLDEPKNLIRVPAGLRDVGVLLEPTSVAEKGIAQAFEIQRRLGVWMPRRAAVLGAGTIGLLATLILRLRGLEVATFGLDEAPYLNSELVEAVEARYVSTRRTPVREAARGFGPFDLIFEATGFSPLVFEAMGALGRNGVLVLSSVTGGSRQVEVPADALNLGFVLGNKVMVGTVNASRRDFESGVRDLATAEAQYPGWLSRLLTHPIQGLRDFAKAFDVLGTPGAIKVFIEVAALS